MAAVKLSSLFGTFKAQAMNTNGMLASVDKFAGRAVNHAINQGSVQMRIMGAVRKNSGNMAAARFAMGSARPGMMRGAMYGAGVGAAGSVLSDTANGDFNGGSVGRAIGGGLRGGVMGGLLGGAGGAVFGRRSTQRIYRNYR